jgi:hypothetical protein
LPLSDPRSLRRNFINEIVNFFVIASEVLYDPARKQNLPKFAWLVISRKVAMKTAEKSRFGKLVAYLLDPQGKKTRVGDVTITNCVSTDATWAVREIAATQRLNARAKSDRTSFGSGSFELLACARVRAIQAHALFEVAVAGQEVESFFDEGLPRERAQEAI